MNRRRQHPAAAAARRARFYRSSGIDERPSGFEGASASGASSGDAGQGTGPSSRGGSLSERVDGGGRTRVEDAA